MSSIKFLRILVVLFSITLFSCEDEPVDPRPVIETSTADCSDPIDVTAVRSDDTSKATILWTANGDQTACKCNTEMLDLQSAPELLWHPTQPLKFFQVYQKMQVMIFMCDRNARQINLVIGLVQLMCP